MAGGSHPSSGFPPVQLGLFRCDCKRCVGRRGGLAQAIRVAAKAREWPEVAHPEKLGRP